MVTGIGDTKLVIQKFCFQQKSQPVLVTTTPVPAEEVLVKTLVAENIPAQPREAGIVPAERKDQKVQAIPAQAVVAGHNVCSSLGYSICNGNCVDPRSDPLNCGSCGNQCSPGEPCTDGGCGKPCPQELSECGRVGECVDLKTDFANCGSCGIHCQPKETCSMGRCISICNMDAAKMNYFSWADWQRKNWLTSVKDQQNCGSCWAESSTGVTESILNIETGFQNNLDLSEQSFVSGCLGDMGSCTGGDHTKVLASLQSGGGPEESVFPWQSGSCGYHEDPPGSKNNVCNADCNNNDPNLHCSIPHSCNPGALAPDHLWKIQSYRRETNDYPLNAYEEFNTIKQAIICRGPLDVCSNHWSHCITLVGWTGYSFNPNGAWIFKNSWGNNYNGNGYGTIPYGNPWSYNPNDYGDIVFDAWSVKGVYRYG